jgi:hypothetical protein
VAARLGVSGGGLDLLPSPAEEGRGERMRRRLLCGGSSSPAPLTPPPGAPPPAAVPLLHRRDVALLHR